MVEINLQKLVCKKATRGRNLVHSTERYKECTDNLTDVLCDLMHYATADGRNFEKELEKARQLYKMDNK
jgi:hypothetical protein